MKILKKAIAGLLLTIGLPVIVLATLDQFNPSKDADEKGDATAALVILGFVPAGVGGFMVWSMYDNTQRRKRDRLRAAFFNLVKAGKGRISAFDFSMETGLAGHEARLYLDERARHFNATFHVDDDGGIFYQFHLGHADSHKLVDDSPNKPETYSLLLQAIPPDREDDVIQVLQDVMNVEADAIREILNEPLMPIQIGVPVAIAKQQRQRLQDAGISVLIVLE